MGCSSSCVCIGKYESILPYPIPGIAEEKRKLIELIIPEIRIIRPSTILRISPAPTRNESLLWEHWQTKECRSHSHRRCDTQGCGLNHDDSDFSNNSEHSPYLVDYWSKKMTFLDRHREISREMTNWDFLDGKPLTQGTCNDEEEFLSEFSEDDFISVIEN